jgi:predicted adenine nucleotide alpha hydrolase (AANH) superfamily ATPase
MKLLMHICCSNCSLYSLKSLLSQGVDVKGLWFNPNIYPRPEYERRLSSLQDLRRLWHLDVEYVDKYGSDDFVRELGNPHDNRCIRCYTVRLEETAKTAKKMNLKGFTTSLLVSPYQKFDSIVSVGREMEKKYSIAFYVEDFRIGYRESIPLSKELGLYRQKYCGCVFSEQENTRLRTKSRTLQ